MKKTRFLLLFSLCLLLPLAAAKAVLSLGWLGSGTSNKGQWLTSELPLLPAVAGKQHWRLVFLNPQPQCETICLEAAYLQQQVFQALGRKQDYLALWQVGGEAQAGFLWQPLPAQAGSYSNDLLLVDAKGLAILRYPVALERAANIATGKAILADLRKLLTYERGL